MLRIHLHSIGNIPFAQTNELLKKIARVSGVPADEVVVLVDKQRKWEEIEEGMYGSTYESGGETFGEILSDRDLTVDQLIEIAAALRNPALLDLRERRLGPIFYRQLTPRVNLF